MKLLKYLNNPWTRVLRRPATLRSVSVNDLEPVSCIAVLP